MSTYWRIEQLILQTCQKHPPMIQDSMISVFGMAQSVEHIHNTVLSTRDLEIALSQEVNTLFAELLSPYRLEIKRLKTALQAAKLSNEQNFIAAQADRDALTAINSILFRMPER